MDGKTLGERIIEARKARDLTQEYLAATIGIDRSALGLIEKGRRKVSAIELVDLAAALTTPLAWFVREPVAAVISRRAEAGPNHEVTARLDQTLELFAGDIAELLADGVIQAAPDRPTWQTPHSVASAETVARQVREHLGLGNEPLTDVAAVAERFGLFSCAMGFGEQGADGALVEVDRGAGVAVIDGDVRVGRRRMSLAHELGHWLFGDAFDSNTSTDTEQMITSFAAFFLAPRAGVSALWNQYRSEQLRDTVIRVAGTYRLSWSAAVLHLHTLQLITDEQRRGLEPHRPTIGEFAKLQITLDTDELRPPSVSPGLAAAVLDAYVDLRISAPRTVELLRGQLDIGELPQPRAETAADYARMG